MFSSLCREVKNINESTSVSFPMNSSTFMLELFNFQKCRDCHYRYL